MEAINEVVEAWLEHVGPKESRNFLRCFASRLAKEPDISNIVPLRRGTGPMRPTTRAWLLERLPGWLMRHG